MAKSKYIETLEEQYTRKDGKSVLRYMAPDNKWRYVQTSKDANGGDPMPSGGMTNVTFQELKDKRDNGELVPGNLYRITDYTNITDVTFDGLTSHQFDIILLALTPNTLAEEGWAAMHDNIYDVTFADNVTKKCYLYKIDNENCYVVDVETLLGYDGLVYYVENDDPEISINDTTKTAMMIGDNGGFESNALDTPNIPYNYFQNSNLSAWKVWYCLDNDKSRFAWADDSVDESSPAYLTYNSINYYRNENSDSEGR